jgi:hypothetical protein
MFCHVTLAERDCRRRLGHFFEERLTIHSADSLVGGAHHHIVKMLPTPSLAHAPFSSLASTSARTLPLLLLRGEYPPLFNHPGRPSREAWEDEDRKGKGKEPMQDGPEKEVDDREWEMRVGGCGSFVERTIAVGEFALSGSLRLIFFLLPDHRRIRNPASPSNAAKHPQPAKG